MQQDEIVEIGAFKYRNSKLAKKLLIEIDKRISESEALELLMNFIGDDVILTYYAAFHMFKLRNRLSELCDLELKHDYVDILTYTKKAFGDYKDHKLGTVVKESNIVVNENAEATRQCAKIQKVYEKVQVYASENGGNDVFLASFKGGPGYKKDSMTDLKPTDTSKINGDNFFFGKSVCISGGLELFKNKKEALLCVANAGGETLAGVVQRLDYLVVRDNVYDDAISGRGTGKMKKAYKLNHEGKANIHMISETMFLEKLK